MSHPIYRLVETTPPATEPLVLSETKTFLRIDHGNDDNFVAGLISAARAACEQATGRSLITRSYSLFLDRWPETSNLPWWDGVREGIRSGGKIAALALPKPPLLSVAQVYVYNIDNSSVEFPSTSYFVDTAGTPGRIVLTAGAVPPLPLRVGNGIEIRYSAGYGAAADNVPMPLRQGMKQIVAHLYEHRGDGPDQALLASGAALLFQPYRLMSMS